MRASSSLTVACASRRESISPANRPLSASDGVRVTGLGPRSRAQFEGPPDHRTVAVPRTVLHLSPEPLSDLVHGGVTSSLGDGIGEGDVFGTDFDAVLAVATVRDASGAR